MRSLVLMFVSLILAACVDHALPTDAVRDADAAIAIAKKQDCRFSNDPSEKWSAWLRDGVWDVRQYFPHSNGSCGWRGVKVRAADGNTGDRCEACVVTE